MITYDLRDPDRDYTSLGEAIKHLSGDWQKPLENVWFIKVKKGDMDANDIYTTLKYYINADKDHLLVIEVGNTADRQGWLSKSFWKWMKEEVEKP